MRFHDRHPAAIHRLVRPRAGGHLWFGADDGAVGLLDPARGTLRVLADLGEPVAGLCELDGGWLAAGRHGALCWLDEDGEQRRAALACDEADNGDHHAIAAAPDGRLLYACGREHVHLLAADGRPIGLAPCRYWAYALAATDDRALFATWSGDVFAPALDALIGPGALPAGATSPYRLAGWIRAPWLDARTSVPGPAFALCPTRHGLVVAGARDDGGFVSLIDVTRGKVRASLELEHGVHALAATRDGEVVYAGGNDEGVRLLALPDLTELGRAWLPTTPTLRRRGGEPYPPTAEFYQAAPGAIRALAVADGDDGVHAAFADGSLAFISRADCEAGAVQVDVVGLRTAIDDLGGMIEALQRDAQAELGSLFDSIIDGKIAELQAELGEAAPPAKRKPRAKAKRTEHRTAKAPAKPARKRPAAKDAPKGKPRAKPAGKPKRPTGKPKSPRPRR